LCFEKTTARNNNQVSIVSCGQPLHGMDVRIVDPETHHALRGNAIGEIWIDGASKCLGYWKRADMTQAVFHARISDEPENPGSYMRTGDLGFFHEGELFVCGRIKDMIIVHGSNYYPQDIEAIVAAEFPNIGPFGPVQTAAFSVEHEGEERLVVALEVRPNSDLVEPATVAKAIRTRYFIDPYQVLFVPPRAISTTTSGKVARGKTRDRWKSGTLPVLASYVHASTSSEDDATLRGLFDRVCELYQLAGDEDVTLTDIGVDSLTLVEMTLEIQGHLERRGLADLVTELDARFLQRLTVVELSRLLDTYDAGPETPAPGLRYWLESRRKADNEHELRLMRADAQWQPPTGSAEDALDAPQSILLTGATGFFGPFLLSSLLQRTTCAIEVIMRAADPAHGLGRLVEALRGIEVWTPEVEEQLLSRVRVLCGDLGVSHLGLTDVEWDRLCNESEAIVHNGALVNYVLSYDALRPYNIGGTRELMRLATTKRKKPFHLISSTFIHGWSPRPVAAEHEFNEGLEELDFGYSQSKCIQEHLVLNAARQGHPVRIYRPALITASSRGIGSKDDIGVRLLAFMIKYGIAVETLNQISFLPADLVSDHIARIFSLRDTSSNTFQVTTTKYYNLMDVTQSITDQFGYTFTYYPMSDFIERMNRLCKPDDLLYPLLVFFNRSHHKFKPMESKRYDNRHYRTALDRTKAEIVEPRYSDTVAYIVTHMQREGLIPIPAKGNPSEAKLPTCPA